MPRELDQFFAVTFESVWRVSARRDHSQGCVCPTVQKIAGISAGSDSHGRPLGYLLHGGRLVAITTEGLRLYNPDGELGGDIKHLVERGQWPRHEAVDKCRTGTLAALFLDEARARSFFAASSSECGRDGCVQTKLVIRRILAVRHSVFQVHPNVLSLLNPPVEEEEAEARAFVLR